MLQPHTVLDRKYRIVGLFGGGGMVAVFGAQQIGLQHHRAITVSCPLATAVATDYNE